MLQTLLDTCVVVDILEQPSKGHKILRSIRDKQVMFVVNETVLRELRRIRRWSADVVLTKLGAIFGKRITVISKSPEGLLARADKLKRKYELTHNGDVHILAQCRMSGYALVTRDGNMRRVAFMMGVPAFHPKHIDKL